MLLPLVNFKETQRIHYSGRFADNYILIPILFPPLSDHVCLSLRYVGDSKRSRLRKKKVFLQIFCLFLKQYTWSIAFPAWKTSNSTKSMFVLDFISSLEAKSCKSFIYSRGTGNNRLGNVAQIKGQLVV